MSNIKNLKPFKPGQSGNPGGRPKVPINVVEASRALTKKAIRTLEEIMLDSKVPPSIRVNAAQALLDRGWGRPSQHLDVSTDQPESNISFDYSGLTEGEMVILLALIGKTQGQDSPKLNMGQIQAFLTAETPEQGDTPLKELQSENP